MPEQPSPPDQLEIPPARDLAAVPAFLRNRLGAGGANPVRHPTVDPPPEATPDPATLPMVGIAPRRLVTIGLVVVLVWVVASFGRQVAEASAASSRADELRAANATLAREVEALEDELQTIQDQRFISQAARAFRLATEREVPFALEAGAPPLPADAPGSASVRLGAEADVRSPLDSWLDVLFGDGR
jgi:cell division protein FtsB